MHMEQHPPHVPPHPRCPPWSPGAMMVMLILVSLYWPKMGETLINKPSSSGGSSAPAQPWPPPPRATAAELSWALAARKGFLPRPAIGL